MSHHFDRLMQCPEYTEVGSFYLHRRQCKQEDLLLTAPASLDAWCAKGSHHCYGEGHREELPGKRAPNIASSCASEQPHLPLKRVLDEFQLPLLRAVRRSRLEVHRACQQHWMQKMFIKSATTLSV